MKVKIISGLIIFSFFLSCKKNENIKIIYKLNKELTNSILKKYKSIENKKDIYYIKFHVGDYTQRSILLSICEDCKIKNIIPNSNRFLRLDENTLLPVMFLTDSLFETNTKYDLTKNVGGDIIFNINHRNQLISVRKSM